MSKLVALTFGLLLFGPLGCRPKIGDKCQTSVDCSVQGDRLCDVTQPDGSCTIFNCEPDGCPQGEAQCVAFNVKLDLACQDAINATTTPRFERSFCMKPCSGDSDCRAGYACVDPRNRNAEIIDSTRDSVSVCMVAASLPPENVTGPDGGPPGVCEPGDASFDVTPYDSGAGGAGGAGGNGGAGGASGKGGAGGA